MSWSVSDQTPAPAQPPVSPDGMWWWDGSSWQPTAAQHAAREAAHSAHAAAAQASQDNAAHEQAQQVVAPATQQARAVGADPVPGRRRADVAPTTGYSNWVKRVAASLVDSALTLPFNLISIAAAFAGAGALGFGAAFGAMVAFAWWNIFYRQGKTGYTIGKQVLGIRLVDAETGLPIGPVKSFLRQLAHILDSFLFVGFLWPLWDGKRQTFADKICSTVVIDEPRTDRTEGNARFVPVAVVIVGLVLGALLSTLMPDLPGGSTVTLGDDTSAPSATETPALDPEAAQAEVWVANWCEAREMQGLDAVLAAMGAPTEIEQGGGENVTLIWEGDNLRFELGFEGERKNDGNYQQVSGEVSRVPCMM